MNKEELRKAIVDLGYIQGDFVLRSGLKSKEYFDKYRFLGTKQIGFEIAYHLSMNMIQNRSIINLPVYYGFLEMGAIPLSIVVLKVLSDILIERQYLIAPKALFIRKEPKKHGTCRMVEGPYDSLEREEVVLIEDVITTGGAAIEAAKVLRNMGAIVKNIYCIIDREADNKLSKYNLELHSLFTMKELTEKE